jgi:hypothetical protein
LDLRYCWELQRTCFDIIGEIVEKQGLFEKTRNFEKTGTFVEK